MIPPHLPIQSCNIKKHNSLINLKLIILVSILGILAGVSGSLVALGWIWPGYGGGDTWIISKERSLSNKQSLEDTVQRESAEKIFSIYKGTSILNGLDYLSANQKIGDGLVVGSDGWLVVYVSKAEKELVFKNWKVLSSKGAIFKVDKLILDSNTNFAYLKISPDNKSLDTSDTETNFKVASFNSSIKLFDEVFVSNNNSWHASRLGYSDSRFSDDSHLDSSPNEIYEIEGNFSAGSVVITDNGRVVGFIDDNGGMLPSIYISRILPLILSNQKIEYPSLGVYGWFSNKQPAISKDSQRINGFIVKSIWSKETKLSPGDVVMKIDGKIVTSENLWYYTGDNISLTIWRDGKIFNLYSPVLFKDIKIVD